MLTLFRVGLFYSCCPAAAGTGTYKVDSVMCATLLSAGPLVLHVAKLFPKNDASSFDAYGRIFSGTLRPGDEVSCNSATCG
jgi:translation elongation factor EF-G